MLSGPAVKTSFNAKRVSLVTQGKEFARDAGDHDSIPGSGSSPGEGNGNPLRYSCLENPMDGGPWRATSPLGRKESHDLVTNNKDSIANYGKLSNPETKVFQNYS